MVVALSTLAAFGSPLLPKGGVGGPDAPSPPPSLHPKEADSPWPKAFAGLLTAAEGPLVLSLTSPSLSLPAIGSSTSPNKRSSIMS